MLLIYDPSDDDSFDYVFSSLPDVSPHGKDDFLLKSLNFDFDAMTLNEKQCCAVSVAIAVIIFILLIATAFSGGGDGWSYGPDETTTIYIGIHNVGYSDVWVAYELDGVTICLEYVEIDEYDGCYVLWEEGASGTYTASLDKHDDGSDEWSETVRLSVGEDVDYYLDIR